MTHRWPEADRRDYDEPASVRLHVRVTPGQRLCLRRVAVENDTDVAGLIREAVEEFTSRITTNGRCSAAGAYRVGDIARLIVPLHSDSRSRHSVTKPSVLFWRSWSTFRSSLKFAAPIKTNTEKVDDRNTPQHRP